LNDQDDRVAHVLTDMHARLAVGEGPNLGGQERHIQLAGNVLRQGGVGVPSDELCKPS
jgi:hypothetical protein